jgi:SAM-dependent methyltransferase
MSFVSSKMGQFRYFDEQLGRPDWASKTVLDFGGNRGNLLRDQNVAIDPSRYWCIDVSRDAIAKGKDAVPEAHWIFYDRHNVEFNPCGIRDLAIPDTGQRFDVIVAYSVFTHTSRQEMIELVGQLRSLLTPDGVLAFTFLDPEWIPWTADPYPGPNLKWRLEKRKELNPAVQIDALLEKGRGANWLALVNDDELYLDDEDESAQSANDGKAYITFCNPEYMQAMFADAEILPPVSPERHHCCVIRGRS